MKKIYIIIADDHAIVRQGLKKIIARTDDIKVAGEAGDSRQLFETLASTPCDVLVLDITMPGADIIKDLKKIKKNHPGLPVLILSMHPENQYAIRTISAGAAGYMTKETAPAVLVKAIRRVAQGGRHISESLAEKMVENLNSNHKINPIKNLSDRELQVFKGLAAGLTTKEIACELDINDRTVATYRRRILEKLGLKNNNELVLYAIREKIVD